MKLPAIFKLRVLWPVISMTRSTFPRSTVSRSSSVMSATTHGKTSMVASVFVGLLDTKTGALDYVNAGHEEAYIVGATGVRLALPPTGPVLGIFAGANHTIATANIERGETILLYTDGVLEATSQSGEQFSEQRVRSLLESWQGSADELLEMIVSSICKFTKGAGQHDDITMLASRRESVLDS
jgi:sigma-B regulation protein RsbU (phosphoserine phosphatase)